MSFEEINERLEKLLADYSVPSNVRKILKESLDNLRNENEDFSLRVNIAISMLEEACNDQNLKQHTRIELWHIATMLESLL